MITKVTSEGVLIPKEMLEGVDEVEIRQEEGIILVVPAGMGDPILQLGKDPITTDMDDASVNHDKYIYRG